MDEDSIARRLAAIEKDIGGLRSGASNDSLKNISNSLADLRKSLRDDLKDLGTSVAEITKLQKATRGELSDLRQQFLDYVSEDRARSSAQAALLAARPSLTGSSATTRLPAGGP